MATAAELLELGDRYWALGLPAAARSALGRAHAGSTDATAALKLTDIALAQGDVAAARMFATEAAKRAPGPATKILLGRAQLAAGELTAARMSILAALDSPKLGPWDRPRAHLELSRAAAAHGDAAGAGAQAGEAFTTVVDVARKSPDDIDVALVEEICAAAVANGRGDESVAHAPALVRVAMLVARQSGGDTAVTDRAIDDELAEVTGGIAIQLRRIERRARKAGVGIERGALATEMAELIASAATTPLPPVDRARMYFLYASLCVDDSERSREAEDAYRKGLAFQPGHTGAACRLALLMIDLGEQAAALVEIERALRIDANQPIAWRRAAQMIDAQSLGVGVIVGRLLDAANPGAGSAASGVAPRLVTATAEVARNDVLSGVYAHGHRVKNLLGIIGARTRSARKLAGSGDVHDRLKDLETDVTALYEEWAQYLRSMQAPTPTVELVTLSPLLHEVVMSAQARTQQVPITLESQGGLLDIRGDRMLLREALLNVVSNAAEACAPAGGTVLVRARAVASPNGGTAPIVELVVSDTGPGIPRAHLSRLFVPGFTTKETGSGVGLAIAERVVAAHHGRITVDSEEGRGTTITITLPTDKAGLSSLPLWSAAERSGP
ncbi:MAG: ATP-binding protein [Kofleriaceae bacterium]